MLDQIFKAYDVRGVYPDQIDAPLCRAIGAAFAHDGFTLNDLVSYNEKHNLANNEDNRDGSNVNNSWNCGEEGDTADPDILALRARQIKNFMALMLFSQGTPMLLMGDEVRRTQQGNNNAYCQDNEISWFDWSCVDKNPDMLRFTSGMIDLINNLHIFKVDNLLATPEDTFEPHIHWHGTEVDQPDWGEHSHTLAFTMMHPIENEKVHVMVNAYWDELSFEIPAPARVGNGVRLSIPKSLPPMIFTYPKKHR